MYSGDVPDYIKNISSPRRKRHFDSLLKKAPKVILQLMSCHLKNLQWKDVSTTYNAWVEDFAMLNIFFGQESVLGWALESFHDLVNSEMTSSLSRYGTQHHHGPCRFCLVSGRAVWPFLWVQRHLFLRDHLMGFFTTVQEHSSIRQETLREINKNSCSKNLF